METEKTKKQTEKAREQAQQTLKIKGLLSFISKKSKKATYKNKLIEELIKSGKYEEIYNRWYKYAELMDKTGDTDEKKIYDVLNDKEIEILMYFDFCPIEELETQKEGFYIKEEPLNI